MPGVSSRVTIVAALLFVIVLMIVWRLLSLYMYRSDVLPVLTMPMKTCTCDTNSHDRNCQLCMKGGGERKWASFNTKQFEHRLVHIDLKGAPPKMQYLLQLLPLFKDLGASGLLIEYEDMYPYEGDFKVLKRKEAYTKEQVLTFVKKADALGLDIVPLVQTFGHLEFILKHSNFKHLRTKDDSLLALNPTNKNSLSVITKLIEDVMRLHPGSKWIHLGGDEVYSLGTSQSDKKSGLGKDALYLLHMKPVLEFVRQRFNSTKSIIWHDMLVDWPITKLRELANLVEPMVWQYRPNAQMFVTTDMLKRFSKVFRRIWAGSAFKGASGQLEDFVPIVERLQNHVSWMRILQQFPGPGQLVGIALTGWSRYDHFATYCELLPAGIPSLGICLGALEFGYVSDESHRRISMQLGMEESIPLDAADATHFQSGVVKSGNAFAGSEIYYLSIRLLRAQKQMNHGINIDQCWSSLWMVKHKFINVEKLQRAKTVLENALSTYKTIEGEVVTILKPYFDDNTANEFQFSKVQAVRLQISETISKLDKKIAEWKKIKL